MTVRLPLSLANIVKHYAFITDRSQNSIVKDALVEYLQTHGRDEMVRAAFEKVLEQHHDALERLKDL